MAKDELVETFPERVLLSTAADAQTPDERRDRQAQLNAPTIALLKKWRSDGEAAWAQMTPEEHAQEEADLDAFKSALNENRKLSGDFRLLFP